MCFFPSPQKTAPLARALRLVLRRFRCAQPRGVAFDRYRFGGEMGFDVETQALGCVHGFAWVRKGLETCGVLITGWSLQPLSEILLGI